MGVSAKVTFMAQNPTNDLPVAIPIGDAIEPEPSIVIYDNTPYGQYDGPHSTTDTTILDATPTSIQMGISPVETSLSCLAVASLTLGVISIVFAIVGMAVGILAIVFGVLAVHRIKHQPNELRGFCLAFSGIITGTLGLVLWISVFLVISTEHPESESIH